VVAVLQLGQLVGKLNLASGEDELNSLLANELSQNLSRARAQLDVLQWNLEGSDATTQRVARMRALFEAIAEQINGDKEAQSLVKLKRSSLLERSNAATLRVQTQEGAAHLSDELGAAERIASDEARDSTRSARRTLWAARLLSLAALAAAVLVGFHSVRRLRESLGGLRQQNEQLASLSRDLQSVNDGLEHLVAERSAKLLARERAMRLVLDAMSDALVSVDLEGYVSGESSKAAVSWFGTTESRTPVWQYLFGKADRLTAEFQLGFAQLAEDIIPFEASASCMPSRFARDGRVYSLDYRQVFEEARFCGILLIIHDVSEHVAAEARERDAREQQRLLSHLLSDKLGLQAFVRDSERLLFALRDSRDRATTLRILHTLKGNAAVYGMESISRHCHLLEDALADREGLLEPAEHQELLTLWHARLERVAEVLAAEDMVQLDEDELGEILGALRQRRDYSEIVHLVESWRWVKTSAILRRLGAQARRIGQTLEKDVEVRIESNQLRVMPGALDDFWSELIHVVRNAVDHGLETPEERTQAGKAATAHLVLRTRLLDDAGISVEVADDGRGLDFEALRRAAEQRGVAATTHEELVEFMFCDGVTTREVATELSGRGVGLGAVAAACRAASGVFDVDTKPGKGTVFRFLFPGSVVQARAGAGHSTFHDVSSRYRAGSAGVDVPRTLV